MAACDMLVEAKGRVGHRRWESWLTSTCNIPPRTARLYMELAEGRETIEANRQRVADLAELSIRGAPRLLKPKPKKKPREPRKNRPLRTRPLRRVPSSSTP